MAPEDRDLTPPEAEKNPPKTPNAEEPLSTHVDNAHASGLGAMGRNDEKLPTGADGNDEMPADMPAY